MAKKIVYLPLDERPCNYLFPQEIFKESNLKIIVPDLSIMGDKKIPANYLKLEEFLINETKNAFGLVISIDTLLYGGIVPSRLHFLDNSILLSRLELLKNIRKNNPSIIIYAFQLIMRCPQNNSSDEEPDYYKTYGRNIFLNGYYQNKMNLGIITDEETKELNAIQIPEEFLKDFLNRRKQNTSFNIETLKLVEEEVINFLIIPQDDASEYGYTAVDQENIRKVIKEKKLMMKVYMYPGADEVGCTLMARMQNLCLKRTPAVFVKYPSPSSGSVVPALEDRFLDTTIKYQILAAGGIMVSSLADADIVLLALCGPYKMFRNNVNVNYRDIDVLTNITDSICFGKYAIEKGKPVMIADLLYLNSGSTELLAYLETSGLILLLAGYAGWNTSSNTLGTVIAHGMNYLEYRDTKSHLEFLMKRYVEDIGYCGYARDKVKEMLEPYSLDYFDVKEKDGIASKLVNDALLEFINKYLSSIKDIFTIDEVILPWKRMFEVSFRTKLK